MSDPIALEQRLRKLEATLEALVTRERALSASAAYTPTYDGGTTPGVTTYGVQVGRYSRNNNRVDYTLWVKWTNATGTGTARIGLPFVPINTTNQRGSAAIYTTSVTFTGSGVQGLYLPNDAHLYLYSPISNALRADVVVEAAGEAVVSGHFYI